MAFVVPRQLATRIEQRGQGAWLAALPEIVANACERWSLTEVGAPFEPGGQTSWVAPVQSEAFGDAVLKVMSRHYEAFDEAKGLRVWDGDGAIRVFADDDLDASTSVLLLERCSPGRALSTEAEEVQDRILSELLLRLWRGAPLPEPFRPLEQMCGLWADACERKSAERPSDADPGLLGAGITLFRELPASADRAVLLCTDLHAGNVLASPREPWLMIDPKPYVGDPAYDILQHMLNCETRLLADPRRLVRDLAGPLDLDPVRVEQWLFARCVVESPDWPELLEVARLLSLG